MVNNRETLNREYKDSLFRTIFGPKEALLSLYNAVNGTDYDVADDLRINTLENVIYMRVKNDISFVMDFSLNLYEHQSSYSGNMSLRFLFYFNELLKNELGEQTLYTSRQIKFPKPVFVVFYNGVGQRPERWSERLSDSFEQATDSPKIELEVLFLNVNYGHNKELMEQCRALEEYAIYVARVRKYAKTMPIERAVERAIEECLQEGILADFLRKHRSEAKRMSILEFDEEREMELIRKAEYEYGRTDGLAEGEMNLLVSMIRKQLLKSKTPEEIADILDLDLKRVNHIVDVISSNINLSDSEIALQIIGDLSFVGTETNVYE